MPFSHWIKNLLKDLKARDWIVTIPILTYVSGFVIVNIYLGSLGVFNFELLRAKYLTSGSLFLLFFALPIAFLVSFLFRELHKIGYSNYLKLTWVFFRISLGSLIIFGLIYLSLNAAFGAGQFPLGIPYLSMPVSFEKLLDIYGPPAVLVLSALALFITGYYMVMTLIVATRIFLVHGARLKRNTSKFSNFVSSITAIKFPHTIIQIFSAPIYGIMLFILLSLLKSTNDIEVIETVSWDRFFLILVLTYLFFGMMAFLPFWRSFEKQKNSGKGEDNPISNLVAGGIFFFLVCLIIYVYSLGVYPFMPQQLGGGRPIAIELITSPNNLVSSTNTFRTFLLDRSPTSVLTIKIDPSTNKFEIIEIPSQNISKITYLHQ